MFIPDDDASLKKDVYPVQADISNSPLKPSDVEVLEAVSVRIDARMRSLRTFAQGLIVIVITTLATIICNQAGAIEWTTKYWVALGGAAGTAVLTSVASYVMRYLVPPE